MARSCNFLNKASAEPQKQKGKERVPEADMVPGKNFKSNQPNKKLKSVTSPSRSGTQKIVEIDLRPSDDENVKKSTPTDGD